ncbi:MAG TPA: glycosyltransferase [Desulfosporosinus sp.]|nr:glycosyltransferase [Desulfosporosinus sp.]
MKITHLCLGCFFVDNYSYQENMLPKFHKILGYDVSVIASLQSFDKNGKASYLEHGGSYINEYGISIIRLDYRKGIRKINRKLKTYIGVFSALEQEAPDLLFIHGCQFWDMRTVIRYVKAHKRIKVFIDNHCDYSNSATNFLSKEIMHKIVWKYMAQKIEPYTTKFYGVLPARVDFLVDLYSLPKEKVKFLAMGADDEKVEEAQNEIVKKAIRAKYYIKEDDFLIMTGGKIDSAKKQTLLLMEAVKQIKDPKVKLIVFGSVTEDLRNKLNSLCNADKVQYIGWIQSQDAYKHFAVADLAVFPGRHSVFWEQVTGLGVPMIVKYWKGTTHVDLGGNVKFLYKDSIAEIKQAIEGLVNSEEYNEMQRIAVAKGMAVFSYKEIAKRSIMVGNRK